MSCQDLVTKEKSPREPKIPINLISDLAIPDPTWFLLVTVLLLLQIFSWLGPILEWAKKLAVVTLASSDWVSSCINLQFNCNFKHFLILQFCKPLYFSHDPQLQLVHSHFLFVHLNLIKVRMNKGVKNELFCSARNHFQLDLYPCHIKMSFLAERVKYRYNNHVVSISYPM